MQRTLLFSIVAILIATAGSIGFWLGRTTVATQDDSKNASPKIVGGPLRQADGSMEYRSDFFGFSFKYPVELGEVSDTDEGNGAHTIVLENEARDKGFQIFVQPYAETSISDEKFREDNPSGVMIEPVDVLIDGERATIFYGRVEGLGETREVWFIHDGYLYEIITYKHLDTWLAEILKTWKFTQ